MQTKINYILFFLLFPWIASAAPSISGISGTVTNGETITVTGTDFGTVRTADFWDSFDDYSEWDCDSNIGCSDPSTGAEWADDGGWTKIVFAGDATYMTGIDPEPLLRIDGDNANFSTGMAYTRSVEYYTGGGGGLPNAGLAWQNFTETDEIYVVLYVRYDAAWEDPYVTMNTEKHIEHFAYSGSLIKANVQLDTYPYQNAGACCSGGCAEWSAARYFPIVGDWGGDTCSIDEPTADGAFPSDGKWHELRYHWKLNTIGNTDGVVEMWLDGTKFIDDSTVDFRASNAAISFGGSNGDRIHFFGNIQAPGTQEFTSPGSGNEWEQSLDDIYIWRSDQSALDSQFPLIPIIYLSNNATWGSGATDILNGDSGFVRQKVGGSTNKGLQAWSDTETKFEVDLTGLDPQQSTYLYVTSWTNETNSTGYQVVEVTPTMTGISGNFSIQ